MVCYIKAKLLRKYTQFIRTHPKLNFKGKYYDRTGEALGKLEATYKGLTFTIERNQVIITGSLHYFYNDGVHNYDDFTLSKLLETLKRLETLFCIDLTETKLLNIEFGVNVHLLFEAYLVLEHLLYHGTKRFKDESVNKGKGDYRLVIHTNYKIKIYDKGLQFELPYQLLRFELHFNKMRDLKKYKIVNLSDLKKIEVLEGLKLELLEKWNKLFLYDWTIDKGNKKLPKDFYDWRIANYWLKLDKNNRNKWKQTYKKFMLKHGKNVKQEIRDLIEFKINQLIYEKATFSPY